MQANQLQVTFISPSWLQEDVPLRQPMLVDEDIIERAAKALFDFVFSSCSRLHWANCDESTKIGFRREAAAVITAVWSDLARVSSCQRD